MQNKLIKPLQASGRMAVTPEQSGILQEQLCEMGYGWLGWDDTKIQHTEKPFIFWDYYDKSICYSDDEYYFNNDFEENPKHIFEEHFTTNNS